MPDRRLPTRLRPLGALAAGLLASACVVGPNYQRPSAPITPQFKEAQGWTPSQPAAAIDKGAWWSIYDDPVLDGLERRVAISNQTVAEYVATYRQARQIVAETRSGLFPTVGASGSIQDEKSPSRGGLATTSSATGGVGAGATTGVGGTTAGTGVTGATGSGASGSSATGSSGGAFITSASGSPITTYSGSLQASWAPDLWGRIRREVESDVATAQADAADIVNARLSAQGTLASTYFELRGADAQIKLLRDTINEYRRYVTLTENQYKAGYVSRANVLAAQTLLYDEEATLTDEASARAQYEHAIAVLVGAPPAELSIAPTGALAVNVPVAPAGVPSLLLQRRPDIAAAERRVDSANALVGVNEAAFYPDLTLTGNTGQENTSFGRLFSAASNYWSVGGTIAETVLDFGQRRAAVRAAAANRDNAVAVYRQTVLTAFQGVEDELSTLRTLQAEIVQRQRTEQAARQSFQLTQNEYRAGTIDYLNVITSAATALSAAQATLTVQQSRLQASALLIQDLGGGWQAGDLPGRSYGKLPAHPAT